LGFRRFGCGLAVQTALALALDHVTHRFEQFAVFAFVLIGLDGVDQAGHEFETLGIHLVAPIAGAGEFVVQVRDARARVEARFEFRLEFIHGQTEEFLLRLQTAPRAGGVLQLFFNGSRIGWDIVFLSLWLHARILEPPVHPDTECTTPESSARLETFLSAISSTCGIGARIIRSPCSENAHFEVG